MKITPVNSNYYNVPEFIVQPSKEPVGTISFKGKVKATADDSMISWGIIAGVALAAFAVAAVTAIGVKNGLNRLRSCAKDFGHKIGKFSQRINHSTQKARPNVRKTVAPKSLLEVDVNKVRQLPEDIRARVIAAINGAVTSEEYQKVIRDFGIWK